DRSVAVSARGELVAERVEGRLVELLEDPPPVIKPTGDAETIGAENERLRLLPMKVVEAFLVEPADERDVLESPIRHEQDAGPIALNDRIRGDRRPDDQLPDALPELTEPRDDRARRVVGRRRHLRRPDRPALLVDEDEVREGAARVDAELQPAGDAHVPPSSLDGTLELTGRSQIREPRRRASPPRGRDPPARPPLPQRRPRRERVA